MEILKANSYNIYVGNLTETFLASEIDINKYSSVFVLVDENTHEYCLPHLMFSVSGLESAEIIEIPSGEENKVLDICYQVWMTLTEKNADRKALFINLGGGVIGDMGGFAATTYKRGIDFIQIPTTLLSQVDASVGGKLGIDFEGYKNQIGVFSEPKVVFIDSVFLETLDNRNVVSGFAEMIKHGLILDANLWNDLKTLDNITSETITPFILPSIRIKNDIVRRDYKEQGERKLLNFGHTIGHAVESIYLNTENSLLHGEAIAIGMCVESIISKKIGLKKEEIVDIISMIKKHFSLKPIDANELQKIESLVVQDKKNSHYKLNFSLLNSIGRSNYDCEVTIDEIRDAILEYNTLLN